ncbi:MAG: DUF2147 domain-containing protein [Xanthobacteraceae bacterium]
MAFASNPAFAEDPTGDWLVAEGNAQIHIENCGNALWGFVGWEKEPGGRDTENPDPSKRDRPTLGLPILLNMQASARKPGWWDGEVYNAQNGKTYTSHIALEGPDSLRGAFCRSFAAARLGAESRRQTHPPPQCRQSPLRPPRPAPPGPRASRPKALPTSRQPRPSPIIAQASRISRGRPISTG